MAYDSWSTPKLGQMIDYARVRLKETQAERRALGEQERRWRKRTYQGEDAELHLRRAEDRIDEMRAELIRRALESLTERRCGKRKGAQHRREPDWLPAPIAGRPIASLE